MSELQSRIGEVTERIAQRSRDTRERYLDQVRAYGQRQPRRQHLSCGNLAHGFAACEGVMILLERGYGCMKLFPAEASGGVDLLSSLASPLPAARFCPTGGIDPEKAKRYLALPNVVCVGGSWLVPRDAVRQGDWARITELARGTGALRQGAAR